MVRVVIHTNIRPATADERARGLTVGNQVETAEWLRQGFAAKGFDAEVTADTTKHGDVHVVQGPHYCFDYWRERSGVEQVLFLNRCFYGDSRFDLSLGWLCPDGSRDFRNAGKDDPKGIPPKMAPLKRDEGHCVVFGDYGRLPKEREWEWIRARYPNVHFRPHPAHAPSGPLEDVWASFQVAIGHSSTVLVDAVLHGLNTSSTDPRHVVNGVGHDREGWLARLTWCQWSHEELMRGDFVEHLC